MSPFAERPVSYNTTQKRTGDDYVKFVPEHRTVLRILNDHAKIAWRHWVAEANGGKGMMATCPNVTAQTKVCPIDLQIAGLEKTDDEYKNRRARKRYIVNVLDRTPVTNCPSCQELQIKTTTNICSNCQADLKKAKFRPLNKVKILEGGPVLFENNLNAIEQTMAQDFDGAEITDYDITFTTQGAGREKKVNALPQQVSALTDDDYLDEEGNRQELFDLEVLAEPTAIESINLMLEGATIADINAARGIA